MFDKVKLWKQWEEGEDFAALPTYLDEAKEQIDHKSGEVRYFGYLKSMRVAIYPNGMSIEGSLPKYLYGGNNIYPLDRHTTQEALSSLGDALHVDIMSAKVTGLEFGYNFVMEHPPREYLQRLGDMPRRQRYSFCNDTIYYRRKGANQPDTMTFYDKIEDAKAKGMKPPKGLENAHILRSEIRFKGNLCKMLNQPQITASTLSEKPFYKDLMKRFVGAYMSIRKLPRLCPEYVSLIKSPKDAQEAFFALVMAKQGTTIDDVNNFVQSLQDAHTFDQRKDYSRLREMLQRVIGKAKMRANDPLISELDDSFLDLQANGG